MFEYIKGTLISKDCQKVVVEANSIGWCFDVCAKAQNILPEEGKNVKLYTVLIHKEDSMKLCGFTSREEREIFSTLTSVSGVGIKMAFALLNGFSAEEIIGCVLNEDFKTLSKAKGIGPKLAQKIIFELKGKFKNYTCTPSLDSKLCPQAIKEAHGVLLGLGYSAKEASFAINNVVKTCENTTSEEILKESLKILALN